MTRKNGLAQLIESCETLKEATAVLVALRTQVGFKDGRVYFDASAERSSRYVCQAFFDPQSQLVHLGLAEAFDKVFGR